MYMWVVQYQPATTSTKCLYIATVVSPVQIVMLDTQGLKQSGTQYTTTTTLALETEMTPNGQLRTQEREEREEGREASSDGERGRESVSEKQPKYSSRGNYAPHKNLSLSLSLFL